MKNKTKNNYPKVDGEKFDIIRRKEFDELKECFEWNIKEEMLNELEKQRDFPFKKKQVERLSKIISWNCAYMAVTK